MCAFIWITESVTSDGVSGSTVVTPFAGVTLGDGCRMRTGARWQVSPNAALGVEAHRTTGSE